MNDEKITTLDMFQLLREDIKSSEARLLADMQKIREDIKSSEARLLADIHGLDDRLRKVEEAVAGKKAVTTFQKTLMDWLFRIAAAVGVGGAIKAFFS